MGVSKLTVCSVFRLVPTGKEKHFPAMLGGCGTMRAGKQEQTKALGQEPVQKHVSHW